MNAAPAIQADKREAVRILGMQIGFREAARRLGLNENTVLQWASRYQWTGLTPHKNSPTNDVITVIKQPGQALQDELAENERETRLSLSRYVKRAAKDAENASLKDAPVIHKAAQVAGLVHRWGEEKPSQQFTLNVLNINSLQIDE